MPSINDAFISNLVSNFLPATFFQDLIKQFVVITVLFAQNLVGEVSMPSFLKEPVLDALEKTALSYNIDLPSTLGKSVKEEGLEEEFVYVADVIDGDTIKLLDGRKVRYIGIDTPELDGDCYSEEAKDKNSELVLGKTVRIVKDVSNTDLYDRLLRYVYVEVSSKRGEVFVNEELIYKGYAHAKEYKPDVEYQDRFAILSKLAKEKNVGMWRACD